MSQARHHVKEESSRRCAGIDGVGEALELDALAMQVADQIDEILHAAGQTVQFPDHERVSLA